MPTFTIKKDWVSIITPCYNGANLIHRLLESVLIQDYPSIQMIVVDDGSTDNSKETIYSYKSKFEEKGYFLIYIYQKNAGQAAAINKALKHVTGEYLCWPDCDDFYNSPESITKFVKLLKNTDDGYGIARTIGNFIDEKNMSPVNWNINWVEGEFLFDDCLLGRGFLMVPINYMVKMMAFDRVNPNRDIYTGRKPQNFQMFEPILYTFKCISTKESLCTVVVRNDSDSHSIKSYSQQMNDIKGYLEIQINTLERIKQLPEEQKRIYKKKVEEFLYGEQLSLAMKHHNNNDSKLIMRDIRRKRLNISFKRKVKYFLLIYCPFLLKLQNVIRQ